MRLAAIALCSVISAGSVAAQPGVCNVTIVRAPDEVREVVEAASGQAFNACTPTAVLLSQRLIGAKVFTK